MIHWTEAELQQHMKAQQKPDTDEPESSLSKRIRLWAKVSGHPCQVLRQSKRAKGLLEPGWPDVTLVMKKRILFLELKTNKGRLSEAQKQIKLQMMALGAEYYVVRSFIQFLEIVT
jgi:VRR-NUC domain.